MYSPHQDDRIERSIIEIHQVVEKRHHFGSLLAPEQAPEQMLGKMCCSLNKWF